jgi:hypothetical protein
MNPYLEQLIQEYIQYTSSIVQNPNLGDNVKPDMLSKMAQSLNLLVPLVNQGQDKQVELEMKARENEMNLKMKQAELEFKAQEHGMKLRQAQENHESALVRGQQAHQMKLSQQNTNDSSKNIEK